MRLRAAANGWQRVHEPAGFGRVAVLSGGSSSQREVSLQSGRAVLDALERRGLDALGFDPDQASLSELLELNVDRVWIALHGAGGAAQGALEFLGLPYSGSGVLGSAIGMDKVRTKWLCQAIGVPTARFVVLRDSQDLEAALEQLGLPLFVKPGSQRSSIGSSRVEHADGLRSAWQEALRFDPMVFAEALIPGAAYTVAVLQGAALPSIPSGLSSPAEQHLGQLALAALAACGAQGWGCADFMMDGTGRPLLVEINTVPDMTERSPVPQAARRADIDFDELAWRVLETSFARTALAA
jgi:D-alanine-D-alanine ligase